MKKNIKRKILFISSLVFLFFIFNVNIAVISMKIFIDSEFEYNKFWVGEKHKIIIKTYPKNIDEKIYIKNLNNKIKELPSRHILMKSSGRECLTVYAKINKINSTICFNIYETPEFTVKEKTPLKIEINSVKQLNLNTYQYPISNIKYISSHPEIIEINNEGKITALRPGNSIITVSGLDNKSIQINVIAISNKGFLRDYTLDLYKANEFNKIMIVVHPDDEILWGGAALYKEKYFVVCLTNGYNLKRAQDFRNILKFTRNGGLILNYPDIQDNIRNNWSDVKNGIIKDMFTLLNYKNWDKIVTHGPDGTTGHIQHKKLSEYVTEVAKKTKKLKNLYYFGKFYKKSEIPKNLTRIKNKELKYKKREVSIYKSEKKTIYRAFFHFLQYENWIPASKYTK